MKMGVRRIKKAYPSVILPKVDRPSTLYYAMYSEINKQSLITEQEEEKRAYTIIYFYFTSFIILLKKKLNKEFG